jgi:transaldolase
MNPLRQLWEEHRQAVWLDFIERDLVSGGGLARLVAEDGVRGVTSNPSIFCAAMTSSGAYDGQIDVLLSGQPEITTDELYEALAIEDIRRAADVLRSVYDASAGGDGFVSLEVSPHLAHDGAGTVAEARRLWQAVDRANLMIKVPATEAGIPAIEELIADGINVNATLMFSLADYEAVSGAYLAGLARCAEPARVASVASFFVSRVDSKVDAKLEEIGTGDALELRGTAATANAQLAYRRFREIFTGDDFAPLAERGARAQRPLWASTSTKNPAYSDVKYVEELIGPDTVNTLPTATLEAFRDHGRLRSALIDGMAGADATLERLAAVGVDLAEITRRLQVDGVAAFAESFDSLMAELSTALRARTAS